MVHRLIIADDHPIFRQGLRSLLDGAEDLCVVGEAADGDALRELVPAADPDVVLVDMNMPQHDVVDFCRWHRQHNFRSRIIVLTHSEGRHVARTVFDAGADGYVVKERAFEELFDAIRSVAAGETYVGT